MALRRLPRSPCPILAAALFAVAGPLSAQTVAGTLVDDDTQEGVAGAKITLLGSAQQLVRSALTDSLGRFALPVPNLGAYYLEAERLGYGTTRSQSFNIGSVDTTTVTFFVSVEAILLDPIVVGVPTVIGSEVFADRLAEGRGLFFTPAMIDSLRPDEYVGEIFKHVQDDVFLRWSSGMRDDGSYGPIPNIRSYRGREGCLHYIVDRTPVPEIFFSEVRNPWSVAPLSDLTPDDLVAIEIYRGWWEVPADYESQLLANTLNTRRKLRDIRLGKCGVVIIWTERGWKGRR